MKITLPAIVASIIGIIVISKSILDVREKQENWQVSLFWLLLFLAIIFVAFDPMIIESALVKLGKTSFTIGQIVGVGFVFVLYIVYRVYVKANRIEKQLNLLTRKIALLKLEKKKRSKS
jgi:hypothetical protein